MTYAVTVLAAASCVLGFLLACALVGGSEQRDRLQAKVEHRDARIEDLENELRHRSMGNHPAGRARVQITGTVEPFVAETERAMAEVVARREALEDRDAGHEGDEGA